jgi:hypothetical protein
VPRRSRTRSRRCTVESPDGSGPTTIGAPNCLTMPESNSPDVPSMAFGTRCQPTRCYVHHRGTWRSSWVAPRAVPVGSGRRTRAQDIYRADAFRHRSPAGLGRQRYSGENLGRHDQLLVTKSSPERGSATLRNVEAPGRSAYYADFGPRQTALGLGFGEGVKAPRFAERRGRLLGRVDDDRGHAGDRR